MTFTLHRGTRRPKVGRLALAAGAIIALGLTACSSTVDTSGQEAEAGSGSSETVAPLTVAVGAANPLFAGPYIAETKGFFEDEGLDVTLMHNTGANTANYMAIGDADVALWSLGVPVMLSIQGKQATQLSNVVGVSLSSDLAGAAGVESIEDLRDGRIGTVAMGTASYGAAGYYNETFDLNAEIVIYPDNPTVLAALASNQIQGATLPHVEFAPLFEDGRAVSLIDSTNPEQLADVWGTDYVIGGMWAIAETVPEKREELVKYLRAIDRAHEWMRGQSAEAVAEELLKNEVFQALSVEQLARYMAVTAPLLGPNGGKISAADWEFALDKMELWGLDGFDASNPAVSYEAMVDTSLLEEATK